MNWTNFELNDYILLDYYNDLDSNWFELDSIIEVPWDDICCDLVLYKYTEVNWKEQGIQGYIIV